MPLFRFLYISCLFNLLFIIDLRAQIVPSVLNQGEWYKLAVLDNGIYSLSGTLLQEYGIDISNIDINNIGIFGYGGGMLAQSLAQAKHNDIPEVSIKIMGADDGSFDSEDQIVFFAQGADFIKFNRDRSNAFPFSYQKNLYADTAYYFLTLTQGTGKRVGTSSEGAVTNTPSLDTYDNFWVHEKDEFNILSPGSGREWYGDDLYNGDRLSLAVSDIGITESTNINVSLDVLGRTTSASTLKVLINQTPLGEIDIEPILGGTYTSKGKEASKVFQINSEEINSNENLEINLAYQASDSRGLAHLNKILLHSTSPLVYDNRVLLFRSSVSLLQSKNQYIVSTTNSNAQIWNVSDSLDPVAITSNYTNGYLQFSASSLEIEEYAVFDPELLEPPVWMGAMDNAGTAISQVPDLLIVVPEALTAAANRLAQLRQQHDKLNVEVVTTESIFNQYASGRRDLTAIRNLVKVLYDADPQKFKYLLLFGNASYDYKNMVEGDANLVPTYQSRNSLHPIYSYPSDDYYAFLEDSEGYWEESFVGDHTLDIGVGRLPVKDIAEAHAVVDKLVNYATNDQSLGNWRTKVTFLADDGDNNRYQKDSELLSADVSNKIDGFDTQKIYLDAYEQKTFPNQEIAPDVNQAIEQTIDKGTLLFNYVGHGNEQRLADENVLNIGMISDWENIDKMPFFVTATCEFGRYDDPQRVSGAERLVLNPKGGAIGMVTTARPVFSNTNYLLNQAFYRHVFSQVDGQFLRIGDIFRKTKNDALNGRDNRNFTLLADPSMQLAYPDHKVIIDDISSTSFQQNLDTLQALDQVVVTGRIVDRKSDSIINDFDGTVSLILHDKAIIAQTRGNEGSSMQYLETNNVINRINARVFDGKFSAKLVVPLNINYQTNEGRISLYAQADEPLGMDAVGGNDSLYIGGTNSSILIDKQPPKIKLFLNDTTFKSGGISSSTPVLIALLEDDQGINLSRQVIGHDITAVLKKIDDSDFYKTVVLNEFYESNTDDFTTGSVFFPMEELEAGLYSLTLTAWDTHNNSSQSSIEFKVGKENRLMIQTFKNFPNPFSLNTNFEVTHNRAGHSLISRFQVYDALGRQLLDSERLIEAAESTISIFDWHANPFITNHKPGVYLAKISLGLAGERESDTRLIRVILTN